MQRPGHLARRLALMVLLLAGVLLAEHGRAADAPDRGIASPAADAGDESIALPDLPDSWDDWLHWIRTWPPVDQLLEDLGALRLTRIMGLPDPRVAAKNSPWGVGHLDLAERGIISPLPAHASQWLASTVRFQGHLARDEPLHLLPHICAHNAYGSYSRLASRTRFWIQSPLLGGGVIPHNQVLSLTELLEVGVRRLELDVHYVPGLLPHAPGLEPLRLCHGGRAAAQLCPAVVGAFPMLSCRDLTGYFDLGHHTGCTPESQSWHGGLQEIASWLKDPRNRDEIVFLEIEDIMQGASEEEFLGPLLAAFTSGVGGTPGDMLFRPADLAAWQATQISSATAMQHWPSHNQLRQMVPHARVVFFGPSSEVNSLHRRWPETRVWMHNLEPAFDYPDNMVKEHESRGGCTLEQFRRAAAGQAVAGTPASKHTQEALLFDRIYEDRTKVSINIVRNNIVDYVGRRDVGMLTPTLVTDIMQCRASACADHLTEQRVAQQYVWSFAPGHGHRACRPGGVHTAMVLAGWAAVGPEFAALETDYPAAPRALTEGQRLALSRALGSAVGRRLTHIGGLEVEELAIVPAGRWVTIGTHAKGAATAIQREVSDPLALPVACRNRVSGEWHLTTKHHRASDNRANACEELARQIGIGPKLLVAAYPTTPHENRLLIEAAASSDVAIGMVWIGTPVIDITLAEASRIRQDASHECHTRWSDIFPSEGLLTFREASEVLQLQANSARPSIAGASVRLISLARLQEALSRGASFLATAAASLNGPARQQQQHHQQKSQSMAGAASDAVSAAVLRDLEATLRYFVLQQRPPGLAEAAKLSTIDPAPGQGEQPDAGKSSSWVGDLVGAPSELLLWAGLLVALAQSSFTLLL